MRGKRKQLIASQPRAQLKESLRSRGFLGRVGFGTRPAVVVIDLIIGFTDPKSPLGADLKAELAATLDILQVARRARVPIFFTTVAYGRTLQDAGLFPLKVSGLKLLVAGSRWVEVDPKLRRESSELVLVKKYASAFFDTPLNSMLKSLSIDTLIVTGCTTSGCVRATVVDALQYGYRAIVARQAVGDRAVAPHQASLFDIDMKYGDVVDMSRVLRYLRRVARNSGSVGRAA